MIQAARQHKTISLLTFEKEVKRKAWLSSAKKCETSEKRKQENLIFPLRATHPRVSGIGTAIATVVYSQPFVVLLLADIQLNVVS